MTRTSQGAQLDLFGAMLDVYAASDASALPNAALYERVANRLGIPAHERQRKEPIGRSGQQHATFARKVRWQQQTAKALGLIERVEGVRGAWQLAARHRKGLHEAGQGTRLIAFSTDLGIAIWARCESVLRGLDQPITLCVTSPPYFLARPRQYGNPADEQAYIDLICRAMEPIVEHLAPGGSICLNVANDVFMSGSPARSLYLERLTLTLADRFGLSLMDRLVWHNPSRPPGPTRWACVERVQLIGTYEPILWFTNDPTRVSADNRRVLREHTRRHVELMRSGGEQRTAVYGDGAHRLREGAFGRQTEGRIPRNVLVHGHRCRDSDQYRRDAAALGLPVHGAQQPIAIPEFLIRFLSQAGDLIVDPFGGVAKAGMAAERQGRRWIVVEAMLEYLQGAAERFKGFPGFRRGIA
jgi:DNA modification methylase